MRNILDWLKAIGVVTALIFVLYAFWVAALIVALIVAIVSVKIWISIQHSIPTLGGTDE